MQWHQRKSLGCNYQCLVFRSLNDLILYKFCFNTFSKMRNLKITKRKFISRLSRLPSYAASNAPTKGLQLKSFSIPFMITTTTSHLKSPWIVPAAVLRYFLHRTFDGYDRHWDQSFSNIWRKIPRFPFHFERKIIKVNLRNEKIRRQLFT